MAFGSTSSKSKWALKTPVVVEKTEDPFQSELAGGRQSRSRLSGKDIGNVPRLWGTALCEGSSSYILEFW